MKQADSALYLAKKKKDTNLAFFDEDAEKILLTHLDIHSQLLLAIEKNQFELLKSKLNLKELMEETLRALWVQADRKNIKFTSKIAPDLPGIVAYNFAMQRLLNNLIYNAIKFSPENGTVRIEVQPSDNNSVQFQIVDSGPGLPEEQVDQVFEKFFRIIDYKHKQKGQGLGLYICKLIAEAHGGTIKAENNIDSGMTFTFTIPLSD